MKKTLVVLLALVFVLSIGATAMAAPSNPFVDVPAKHWAYDAVSQLAKAGIVDGYGDGTYHGDKTITRYEMAQIVAKALAREDKANAENKALINKLAVEFAAELNTLGVRVAQLETNTTTPFGPSMKIYGDARTYFKENGSTIGTVGAAPSAGSTTGYGTAGQAGTSTFPTTKYSERFRLNADVNVTDNFFVQSRLIFQSQTSGHNQSDAAQADTVQNGTENTAAIQLDYGFMQFKNVIGGVDLRIGRDALGQGYGVLSGTTGGYDEVRTLFNSGDKVKGWVAYGDIAPYIAYTNTSATTGLSTNTNPGGSVSAITGLASEPAIDVTTSNVVWNVNKDLQFTNSFYWSNTQNYNYKDYSFGMKANLTPGLYLVGEYVRNTDKDNIYLGEGLDAAKITSGAIASTTGTTYANGTSGPLTSSAGQKTAYYVQLGYTHGANNTNNGIDFANPGAFGMFAGYIHLGGQAADYNLSSLNVFETPNDPFLYDNGEKGMGYAIQYDPIKNVRLSGIYETLKSLDGSIKRAPYTYIRAEYNF